MNVTASRLALALIAVATKLFFEQGYPETSLDQIIEQCGGSKQTLYRYFGDKKGILVEVGRVDRNGLPQHQLN